ncbi:MAG TPA: acyloxyacyl hydrolase [Vitreimonas sp.]|uniref:acyloxyacyl hydrolase n=1 Tax=Vitreimonas sp. TaxID=3069702 RepID=UPI002D466619|nr:acyloxyacyl hydrolase [Vitreimonas sp.]HYD86957.1 acyloxyacyl hydrolase [Vitreimonas sp.]
MRGTAAGLAIFGAAMMMAPSAEAGVDEIHVGVMQHNICVINCKNADKEDGPNVEVQVSFDSPDFLSWAFSPQPYLMASVNTAGDTSFGGFGLEWRWEFAENWALEPGVGYVVHDGEIENPYPNGSPEAAAFAAENVQYGSRDLFRTSLGLTRDFEGPLEGQIFYEHLSHGQILGTGRNQGVDQIGIRIGYQFGE